MFFSTRKWAGWKPRLSECRKSRPRCGSLESDDDVRLFYEYYARTIVGGKWLCAVVKYLAEHAFVVRHI